MRLPFEGQTTDAMVMFAIAMISVAAWAITVCMNYRWLARSNGERPFVRLVLFSSSAFLVLAVSFAANSWLTRDVPNDPFLRSSFLLNRGVVALAPLGIWRLRRNIDKRRH